MTVRLKEAFDKAARLPDELQNELADELIADVEAESQSIPAVERESI